MKRARNHVSSLKSVRSGLGLFHEVLALSLPHYAATQATAACFHLVRQSVAILMKAIFQQPREVISQKLAQIFTRTEG